MEPSAVASSEGSGLVEHTLLTADGSAVQVMFNPETGAYTTLDGQAVILQQEEAAEQGEELGDGLPVEGSVQAENISQGEIEVIQQVDQATTEGGDATQQQQAEAGEVFTGHETSDLSSLAAAAETHSTLQSNTIQAEASSLQDIRILNPDGTLSQLQAEIPVMGADQQVKIISGGVDNETVLQHHLVQAQPVAAPEGQQIRIIGPDGSVSFGNAIQAPDTSQPQIRIVKMEAEQPTVQQLIQDPPQVVQEQPQIRILNADGSIASLGGNMRVINANQVQQAAPLAMPKGPTQVRVVRGGAGAATARAAPTISLSQAQQMGLLSPSKSTSIRLSPVKAGASAAQATGSTGTAEVRQVYFRTASGEIQQPQQVIRIPNSALGQGQITPGSIQQINVGGKVQYVRVIGASGQQSPKHIGATGSSQGKANAAVKIAAKGPANAQRVIYPSAAKDDLKPVLAGVSGYETLLPADKEHVKPQEAVDTPLSASAQQSNTFEPTGVRLRKPCNCTKSQCLKLYCDCFANGEFCNNCNCTNCFNNLDHEEERQKQIKTCLDRNPNAFKPKIGRLPGVEGNERRHNKGCHCKRSGCLKNYCECYEAKIPCTDACKCLGCKNVEEVSLTTAADRKKLLTKSGAASLGNLLRQQQIEQQYVPIKPSLQNKLAPALSTNGFKAVTATGERLPFSYITNEVVEATCQCLLTQGEVAERAAGSKGQGASETEMESLILEEFGRCLSQIIDIAKKSKPGEQANAAS